MPPYGNIFLEPKFSNIPTYLKELPWAVWIDDAIKQGEPPVITGGRKKRGGKNGCG